MDLLEKIHFNRVIHQVMAQLHHPLLSHDEIKNLQNSLNTLISVCPNKQINEQAQMLLQQVALKSSALYFAEDGKHLDSFLGTVMIPIDLVELLTQHEGIGWGVLSKNNSLWQIMLKYSKNIEHSIWVEHLTELTPWLDAQMEIAQHHITEQVAFGSTASSSNKGKAQATSSPAKQELPSFDLAVNKPAQNQASSKPTTTSHPHQDTFELADFSVGNNKAVNPFDAMRAQLDQSSNTATLELTTIGSTAVAKGSEQAHLLNELVTPDLLQQTVEQLPNQHQVALTPEMLEQITNALAEKLKPQTPTIKVESSSLAQTLKKEPTLPKPIELPKPIPVEKPHTHHSALNDDITVNFSSFTAPSIPENEEKTTLPTTSINLTAQQMAAPITPKLTQNVETWDCEFKLGQDLELSYFHIQLKKYFGYLSLITLNTDMAKIQHQPIYMTEIINAQNQFKHYLLIFASDTNHQAMDFIHQFTHHHQDTVAHIAQITWQEFKKYAFDLGLCCQLYHTAPVVMKSHILYSHISSSLISKQQMLYFDEMPANINTPLLLLQENSRFRVIHGQNRLNIEAPLDMYPCIILSRTSGITWQIVREQLKFLSHPVNVYQLFEALQHVIQHEE